MRLIALGAKEEKNVLGSALLCVAEVVSTLEALAIPQLPGERGTGAGPPYKASATNWEVNRVTFFLPVSRSLQFDFVGEDFSSNWKTVFPFAFMMCGAAGFAPWTSSPRKQWW